MPYKIIIPATAMIFSTILMDFAKNKWETTASLGVLLYAVIWFIQTMKEVC